MSAKRHQIPQMMPVKADRERGEQLMEHRSAEWSRGPRDLEQTTDREGSDGPTGRDDERDRGSSI